MIRLDLEYLSSVPAANLILVLASALVFLRAEVRVSVSAQLILVAVAVL